MLIWLSGIGDLSQFEMRAKLSPVAPNAEDVHLPAKAVDELLQVVHRIDIKIDVSKSVTDESPLRAVMPFPNLFLTARYQLFSGHRQFRPDGLLWAVRRWRFGASLRGPHLST
jgi:hypothetical protein